MAGLGAAVGLIASVYMSVLDDSAGSLVLTILVVTASGALGGRFGWQCAALMRRLGARAAVAV
jgi:hypothetical protein